MLLTLAIPTLPARVRTLTSLLAELYKQIGTANLGELVEVLVLSDNKQRTVGYKRNWLLDHARGDFTAFIDDDDRVANNYVSRIVTAIQANPLIDCVGFCGIYTNIRQGNAKKKFIHSLQFEDYYEKQGILYRCPNHLNPIRTELARRCRFPDKNFGEDTLWAKALRDTKLLRTEFFLPEPAMYFYDYVSNKK